MGFGDPAEAEERVRVSRQLHCEDRPGGTRSADRLTDRRERQRQLIRARILAAALEVFDERGYAAAPVDLIAERADLARRTVFNHFPRKRDMLTAWATERRAHVLARLEQEASQRTSAREQLALQMRVLAEANEANPPMARALAIGWLTELGTLDEPFPVFDTLLPSIRLGQQQDEFRSSVPAETVAELLCAGYTDTLHRWLQATRRPDSRPFSLYVALRTKLDLVLDGLAVPSS
ncbi:TetR/AcrR family transcriptional regulator [Streptomyces sp. NPDC090493]|uniref:TetR/AcrR family transcriptional regulator n=1 Tax=Streptomyces sp. NPDC090493 TaxID=3365964 RepID=UPI0037F98B51